MSGSRSFTHIPHWRGLIRLKLILALKKSMLNNQFSRIIRQQYDRKRYHFLVERKLLLRHRFHKSTCFQVVQGQADESALQAWHWRFQVRCWGKRLASKCKNVSTSDDNLCLSPIFNFRDRFSITAMRMNQTHSQGSIYKLVLSWEVWLRFGQDTGLWNLYNSI